LDRSFRRIVGSANKKVVKELVTPVRKLNAGSSEARNV